MSEHQIFAKVDYECRMNGAEYLAYPPVVAGGDRATIIHYINNNQVVADGEMVLMDAGIFAHIFFYVFNKPFWETKISRPFYILSTLIFYIRIQV